MKFDISHDLGQDEAKRRILLGLPKLEKHLPGAGTIKATWPSDYCLALEIKTLGQSIPVALEIEQGTVTGNIAIPMMLRMMSAPISDFVKTSAAKMLAHD